MEEQSIEFKAPEGLEIPENINPGDAFETMATVVLGEDGELYLKEIDGLPVFAGEEQEEEVSDGMQEEEGFLEAVERRASGS